MLLRTVTVVHSKLQSYPIISSLDNSQLDKMKSTKAESTNEVLGKYTQLGQENLKDLVSSLLQI